MKIKRVIIIEYSNGKRIKTPYPVGRTWAGSLPAAYGVFMKGGENMNLFDMFRGVVCYTNKKGKWFLNSIRMTLKNTGKRQTVYYFTKSKRKSSISRMPPGYKIIENKISGMPLLRKI